MCSSLLRRLARAWRVVQVELHGQYSTPRLCQLKRYCLLVSPARVACVLLATPLPSLLTIIMCDVVPLHAPESGLAYSHAFWARLALATWLSSITVMQQFKSFMDQLVVTPKQIITIATLCTIGATGCCYALASWVGYPFPFTMLAVSPPYGVILSGCIAFVWGRQIIDQRHELREAGIHYFGALGVQTALTIVYPAYNYQFERLNATEQTLFALILPLMKLWAMNILAKCLTTREELKAGFVVFNIEVFHALFVTFSMRTVTSAYTTAALIGVDAIHALISLYDISQMQRSLQTMLCPSNGPQGVVSVTDHAIYLLHLRTADPKLGPQDSRLFEIRQPLNKSNQVLPTLPSSSRFPSSTHLALSYSETLVDKAQLGLTDSEKKRLGQLSPSQRTLFNKGAARLLYTAEFVLLVEFTEVIIPVLYCIYLSIVFHLPNRVYYPQLDHITQETLGEMIRNVLTYSILEGASFFVLCFLLRRRTRLNGFKQLAFVLEKHWWLIQSKIVLWVVFAVSTTLRHFGCDYTFQFAWLRVETSSLTT